MAKAVLFIPTEEAIDRSLDARQCVTRLKKRLTIDQRPYGGDFGDLPGAEDVDSVAVLAGLSALEFDSGYMEMDLDTILQPQELLGTLRSALPDDFPIIAIVDDAFSDYIMSAYLKAGASAVVGTSGDLFGAVTSRIPRWEMLYPYMNVYRRV